MMIKKTSERIFGGFTLVEIIAAVLVLSVIVSLGFLSYERILLRVRERTAILKLMEIGSTARMYHVKNAQYPDCQFCSEEEDIQNALGIHVTHEPFDISCHFYPGQYQCYASYPIVEGSQWEKRIFMLTINSNFEGQVACQKTGHCGLCTCPTCEDISNGGCSFP